MEVLDLLADLNETRRRTLVLVLHDLNQACRYGHHLVALRDGAIVAEGPPSAVVTAEMVHHVFGLPTVIVPDHVAGSPLVVPIGARQRMRDGLALG